MAKKQSGGVNVKDVSGTLHVNRDLIGGDKNENFYFEDKTVEEKSGFAFFVERVVAFGFTLFIGSIVLSVFIGGAGMLIAQATEQEFVPYICEGIALLMAVGMAIANSANVKRYR